MSEHDRRSSRTRRALKQVLIDLMRKQSLQHITVQEIADAADISRGTFYLHYRDIFHLYQALEDDVVSSIEAIVAKPGPVTDEDALRRMMDAIFAHLSSHYDAYEALLKTDGTAFLEHIFERIRPSSQESWPAPSARTARCASFPHLRVLRLRRHAEEVDGRRHAGTP